MRISDWSSDVCSSDLADQRREVGVAADDDEAVDVRLGIAEVEGIDDEADVGRVLAGLAQVRDLDELEGRLVHGRLEILVARPVAVGFLHQDVALQQQALEHPRDVEGGILRILHAEGRSEEHTSELQYLMRNSYAVF